MHPIQHVDERDQLIHRHGSHSDEEGSLCDALAALTACASSVLVLSPTHAPQPGASVHLPDAPRLAQAPPFLAQGPPPALV